MAKLGGFNANEHEELEDYSAMPAGEYVGKITDSDYIENKAKTGHYYKFTFQLTEGKFKGRKLWTNLNTDHPNAEAVEIANRELSTIMKACGKVTAEDTEELHGIEMTLKVAVKKASPNYPESNEIKNYKPLAGVSTPSKSSGSESSGETQKKKSRVSFD